MSDWKASLEYKEWKIKQLSHQIGKITVKVKIESSI